jgi:tRNA threonylcarbamoyladenosine biosynthesis protein TsaB
MNCSDSFRRRYMLLLAFDTSTRNASVALCTENALICEYTWFVGNNHSVDLLEYVQRMTAEQQISLQQLDAIATATGPGSFNGVRVALATAKALAFALGKPLVGISTLELIAARHNYWWGPVCALLDAGRSELYAACYRFTLQHDNEGSVSYRGQQLGDYQVLQPQALADYLRAQAPEWQALFTASSEQPVPTERESKLAVPPFLFCGEVSVASRQALLQYLPQQSLFLDAMQSTRHASLLAQLAVQRLQDGRVDDPFVLEPLYLRRPSITKSTRKQPLLGGIAERPGGHDTTEREEGALRH